MTLPSHKVTNRWHPLYGRPVRLETIEHRSSGHVARVLRNSPKKLRTWRCSREGAK